MMMADDDIWWLTKQNLKKNVGPNLSPIVVAYTCNPATLEVEFGNGVGSIPVGVNSPSIGG